MTFYLKTKSWSSQPQLSEIVQLPNGFFQTEYEDIDNEGKWIDVTRRETMSGAEAAIDGSVEHYAKKAEFSDGPKVVKTFK